MSNNHPAENLLQIGTRYVATKNILGIKHICVSNVWMPVHRDSRECLNCAYVGYPGHHDPCSLCTKLGHENLFTPKGTNSLGVTSSCDYCDFYPEDEQIEICERCEDCSFYNDGQGTWED